MKLLFNFLLYSFVIFIFGCGQDKISKYSVPKEKSSVKAQMVSEKSHSSHQRHLLWTTPEGWTEKPGNSIRIGSFEVAFKDNEKGDVSIVSLPGDAGGLLANVNRWRGQLGLASINKEELSQNSSNLNLNEIEFKWVEIYSGSSSESKAMLVALFMHDNSTWFVKMIGSKLLIDHEKESFRKLLASFKFNH